MDQKNIQAYPLSWPDGWKRTPAGERRYGHFNRKERQYCPSTVPGNPGSNLTTTKNLTVTDSLQRLIQSLERMGVQRQDVIVSTNVRTRLDGMPRSGEKEPEDPGVAVYWKRDGEKMRSMAVDQYTTVADNLAALAATLEAFRTIDRHGGAQILDRAFRGFAALPENTSQPWRNVMGFAINVPVSRDDVERKYRDLVKVHHPDIGGDRDRFEAITQARKDALAEVA